MRAYFYKLHNILYVIILIPILLFAYLHLEAMSAPVPVNPSQPVVTYLSMCGFVAAVAFSIWYFANHLKRVKKTEGLGDKLKQYAKLSVVRFFFIAVGCMLLVWGYWITNDPFIIALFMVSMIVLSLWWPSPGKVCKDLRLKGDEREMVFYRKDVL